MSAKTINRGPLFDYIKRLMGRNYKQAEVVELDRRIYAMLAGGAMPAPPPDTKPDPFDPQEFIARHVNLDAAALDGGAVSKAAAKLGVSTAHVWAVRKVEANGGSFDNRGRPVILFEPHVFHRRTDGRWSPSEFSYRRWKERPYPRGFDARWAQMAKAADHNEAAAIESASWGMAQIMGFHWKRLGYASPQDFALAMVSGEPAQLDALVRFIMAEGLQDELAACRKGDPKSCEAFVARYNGTGQVKHYSRLLAAAL